jgi:2-isopropylmalate synthase
MIGNAVSDASARAERPVVRVPVKPTAHDVATGRDPERVRIFDTTCRDGEQSPGAAMNAEEKLTLARQLAALGVDVLEAGFPAASNGDFEAVRRIAEQVGNRPNPPIICGLARATAADIKRCWEAIEVAAFPRIHTFIATSDIHLEHKLRKTRAEVLDIISEQVRYACSLCKDVEFSAEDATRSDPEFLYEAFRRAAEAGATTLNVPDTCGYITPNEMYTLIRGIYENVPGVRTGDVILSVHGHDDLGMSVANFLAACEAGARQVEVTVNGIGERAGNASLEELVMALYVRRNYYARVFGRDDIASGHSDRQLTNIQFREIAKTSRMVSSLTGMVVAPNKAVVGANAFRHESGIHQHGYLRNASTYSILSADTVGATTNAISLGKLSGRAAFRARLTELGYELSDDDLNRAFLRFKELADRKREITDADLEAIVSGGLKEIGVEHFKLKRVQVQCGSSSIPTATVTLLVMETGKEVTVPRTGTGPVDAAYCAVNAVVAQHGLDIELLEYTVSSVTSGIDSLGEVMVRVRDRRMDRIFTGYAADTDVVTASVQAYVNALNRCSRNTNTPQPIHPQHSSA